MLLCPPQADCKLLKHAESYQACTHFYAARVMESVFVLSMFDVKTEWKRERENVITNVITFSTATKKCSLFTSPLIGSVEQV